MLNVTVKTSTGKAAGSDQSSPTVMELRSGLGTTASPTLASRLDPEGKPVTGVDTRSPDHRGVRRFVRTLAAALSYECETAPSPPTGHDAVLGAAAAALPHFYDFGWHRRLLDLGGGEGCWSIAAATMCPGLRATVLARPSAVNLARDQVAVAGVASRVEVVDRELTRGRMPSGYDVVLLADEIHRRTPADNQALLERLRSSVTYGARLLLPDPWTQKTPIPTGTATATQRGTGEESAGYQVEQIREWLRRAGWRYFWRTPLVRPYGLVVADAA